MHSRAHAKIIEVIGLSQRESRSIWHVGLGINEDNEVAQIQGQDNLRALHNWFVAQKSSLYPSYSRYVPKLKDVCLDVRCIEAAFLTRKISGACAAIENRAKASRSSGRVPAVISIRSSLDCAGVYEVPLSCSGTYIRGPDRKVCKHEAKGT